MCVFLSSFEVYFYEEKWLLFFILNTFVILNILRKYIFGLTLYSRGGPRPPPRCHVATAVLISMLGIHNWNVKMVNRHKVEGHKIKLFAITEKNPYLYEIQKFDKCHKKLKIVNNIIADNVDAIKLH